MAVGHFIHFFKLISMKFLRNWSEILKCTKNTLDPMQFPYRSHRGGLYPELNKKDKEWGLMVSNQNKSIFKLVSSWAFTFGVRPVYKHMSQLMWKQNHHKICRWFYYCYYCYYSSLWQWVWPWSGRGSVFVVVWGILSLDRYIKD